MACIRVMMFHSVVAMLTPMNHVFIEMSPKELAPNTNHLYTPMDVQGL